MLRILAFTPCLVLHQSKSRIVHNKLCCILKNSNCPLLNLVASLSHFAEVYPIVLHEINENAANFIYNENHEKAVTMLTKGKQILDQICLGDYKSDPAIALMTYHNLALCHQKYQCINMW